jgi:DUF4097 and DUF4098 domain-containing protein YvlB
MKRTVSLTVVVAAALAALAAYANGTAPAHAAQPQQQSDFRWHEPLAAGRVIEIKGINGNVEATPAAGGEVEVVAVKRAHRNNPEDVRIEVVRHGEGVTICAIYPNQVGDSCHDRETRKNQRRNNNDNNVEVDFVVRVPEGVRFVGRTVNGSVEATGLTADAEVSTVNGDASVSTRGWAEATTVNGDVDATVGRADWRGSADFQTVNGTVTVTLPGSVDADVEARTVNGEIETDFPLTVTGRFGPRRLNGRIGSGGRTLSLETVNGAIRIRRAS